MTTFTEIPAALARCENRAADLTAIGAAWCVIPGGCRVVQFEGRFFVPRNDGDGWAEVPADTWEQAE